MMRAYKFLARGAIGTFSGFAWPTPGDAEPGPWVAVEGALELGRRGVHVCRASELAHWLHEELWQLDIDGDLLEGVDCLVVRRARLRRRIAAWTAQGAERFAHACVERARAEVGAHPAPPIDELLSDAAAAACAGYPAVAAFSAALAVARQSADASAAYGSERAWQSAWIDRELIGDNDSL